MAPPKGVCQLFEVKLPQEKLFINFETIVHFFHAEFSSLTAVNLQLVIKLCQILGNENGTTIFFIHENYYYLFTI
jgi:hypothetical protein